MDAIIEHDLNGEKETIHSLFKTYIRDVSQRIIESKPGFIPEGFIRIDDELAVGLKASPPIDFSKIDRHVSLAIYDQSEAPEPEDTAIQNLTSSWQRKTKSDSIVFRLDDPPGDVLKAVLWDCSSNPPGNSTENVEATDHVVAIQHYSLPEWGKTDPYAMGTASVDGCLRQLVASGANPDRIALLCSLSLSDRDNPEELGTLVEATKGVGKAAEVYQLPFIRNNRELCSDPLQIVISGIGIVEDNAHIVAKSLSRPDSILAVVGATENPLGGSYLARNTGISDAYVPETLLRKNLALYHSLYDGIKCGWIQSAHDIGKGGLAVTLSELGFRSNYGFDINLDQLPVNGKLSKTAMLFSESPGRLLIEIAAKDFHMAEALFAGHPFGQIGAASTKHNNLSIEWGNQILINEAISALKSSRDNPPFE